MFKEFLAACSRRNPRIETIPVVCTSLVNKTSNTSQKVMCIAHSHPSPIAVYITKEQAMQFFGLIEA